MAASSMPWEPLNDVADPSEGDRGHRSVLAVALPLGSCGSASVRVTQPPSGPASNAALVALTCTKSDTCFAVGSLGAAVGVPLIEEWDGTQWRVAPEDATLPSGGLTGVACADLHHCFALGGQVAPAQTGVIDEWNGSMWHAALAHVSRWLRRLHLDPP